LVTELRSSRTDLARIVEAAHRNKLPCLVVPGQSVASLIWVARPAAQPATLFIEIDGYPRAGAILFALSLKRCSTISQLTFSRKALTYLPFSPAS